MSFRTKVKRAMGRGSSNSSSPQTPSSPTTQSQEISRVQTPTIQVSGSGSPIDPADREHLTIDPREVAALTLVESNATTIKKRGTFSRIKSTFKKDDPFKDWPEDIYKPHEIPRAKYRRPVDPDHQQTLQAYSLRGAFADMRRKSFLSQYSPMGSRLASRHGSRAPSRTHSIVGLTPDEMNSIDAAAAAAAATAATSPIPIRNRADTVTTLTGEVPDLVQSSSIDSDDADSFLTSSQTVTLGNVSRPGGDAFEGHGFSKPFDGEELTRALTRKLIAGDE